MARWCVCRRMATRRGTNPFGCGSLRQRRLPRNMYDREAMLASLDRLAALERSGARIFFGHDPEFWQTVPQAPVPIA